MRLVLRIQRIIISPNVRAFSACDGLMHEETNTKQGLVATVSLQSSGAVCITFTRLLKWYDEVHCDNPSGCFPTLI